jgi:hypothetical protein
MEPNLAVSRAIDDQPSLAGLNRLGDGTQHCVLGKVQIVPAGLDGEWKSGVRITAGQS